MKIGIFSLRMAATAAFFSLSALAQTGILNTGGRLTLTTPGTDQNVKVEVLGPTTRLFGFPGIADGTAYQNLTGVTVITGAGVDQVQFDGETSQSYDIRVDTGAGQSSTQVEWKILPGAGLATVNVSLAGAALQRLVKLELESETQNAAYVVDAGTASELTGKVLSTNTSNFLRASFAGTSPKSGFELVSAAAALEVDIRGGGTAGMDEMVYKVIQTRAAPVSVNWNLNTGAGDDKVEAIVSAVGGNVTQRGTASAGAGNDFVMFETDAFATVTGLTINGGDGDDFLTQMIKGRFQNSQTLGTSMFGGNGEDRLVLMTDTGIFGTGLPNDREAVIDCGPGNDWFNAFGIIRGCEARL